MKVTTSIPKPLVEAARQLAQARGMSLSQMIREELVRLAGTQDLAATLGELRHLWSEGGGRARGWRWNREELHHRALVR